MKMSLSPKSVSAFFALAVMGEMFIIHAQEQNCASRGLVPTVKYKKECAAPATVGVAGHSHDTPTPGSGARCTLRPVIVCTTPPNRDREHFAREEELGQDEQVESQDHGHSHGHSHSHAPVQAPAQPASHSHQSHTPVSPVDMPMIEDGLNPGESHFTEALGSSSDGNVDYGSSPSYGTNTGNYGPKGGNGYTANAGYDRPAPRQYGNQNQNQGYRSEPSSWGNKQMHQNQHQRAYKEQPMGQRKYGPGFNSAFVRHNKQKQDSMEIVLSPDFNYL